LTPVDLIQCHLVSASQTCYLPPVIQCNDILLLRVTDTGQTFTVHIPG